jgi:hypothetical protein
MKTKYKIISLLVVVGLALTALFAFPTITGTLTSRALTFSKVKGTALVPAKMIVLPGDSVYLSGIEINGTWSVGKPWPYQAIAWLQDKTSDNPLASLDWTGITIDSTWACSDLGSGVGKYTISKKYTQEYLNGGWTNAALTGFLAKNSAYSVEVYSVKSGTPTLLKTLNFDKAKGDTNFSRALYEVSYVAEGRGSYPINAAKRPDSLVSATVASRVYLRNGMSDAWFTIPTGADSLRYTFKSKDGAFASVSQALQFLTSDEVGCEPEVKVLTPMPSQGFYNPGDTLEIQIDLKNNAGTVLDWVTNGANLGLPRIEVLLSGPKDDYYQIFTNRYIYNGASGFSYDSVMKAKYNSNKVKMIIPKTLPNGPGTYTIFVGARRTLGANYQKVLLTDVQIGSTTVQKLNFTSQDPTKSCSKCHGIDGPVLHHAASGVEECLPCHTKTFRSGFGFDEIAHGYHHIYTNDLEHEKLPVESCTQCHLNGSENKFGKEAPTACGACHPVIPFMPLDHATTAPLYNASGMGCNNSNCHANGGMGVFKTITETHSGLAAKYTGGKVTAKKIAYDLAIDSFDDAVWNKAEAITNKDGVKLQFFYSDNNLFVRAEWEDGHQNFGGKAVGSMSQTRNQWSFDGTTWTKSGNEDRLAFLWAMTSSYGASCSQSCHGYSYFSPAGHGTVDGRMDNWHWKAQRTMPIDYVDDGYWDNAGRKSDVATGSFGTDNQNTAGTRPSLMAIDPLNNTKPYVLLSETVAFDSTKFKAGDKIFGYAVNDATTPAISGSRADVRSKARFNETTKKWTVIFKRALNTGNTDDAVFDIAKTIDFTCAKMDNEGSKHAAQGFDIGVYTLSFSKEVVSVEKAVNPVTNINVYPNPVKENSVLAITVTRPEVVNVYLTDIKGNIVAVINNKMLNAGDYQLPMNLSSLASGVYYCRIYFNDQMIVKPIVYFK